MHEEEEQDEQLQLPDMYKAGFNQGYLISENVPEANLKKMKFPENSPSEYMLGFTDGQQAHERDRRMEEIRKRQSQGKDKSPER